MEFQVGDLVQTPTELTGKIVVFSKDRQYAYVEGHGELGASLHRFSVASLQRIEQSPEHRNFPSAH